MAHASTINLDSRPGLANTLTAGTVAIALHPAWQLNHPVNPGNAGDISAVWISYALTGYVDPVFSPELGTTPVVSIFQDFTSGAGSLLLRVWADDTAEVLLDGVSLIAPKFTQSTCSGQPIGCMPDDAGLLSSGLTAGAHQLEFKLFQVGSGTDTKGNPFGLLYTGTATAPAPEPGSLELTGSVLLAVVMMKKRARRRA